MTVCIPYSEAARRFLSVKQPERSACEKRTEKPPSIEGHDRVAITILSPARLIGRDPKVPRERQLHRSIAARAGASAEIRVLCTVVPGAAHVGSLARLYAARLEIRAL